MKRLRLLLPLLLGSLAMGAAPAMAAEAPQQGQDQGGSPLGLLGDVVDGVGGVLKVLVGPPISSPSPYLNMPGAGYPKDAPAEPAKQPAPQPRPNEAPAATAAPVPAPAPVAPPVTAAPSAPQPKPVVVLPPPPKPPTPPAPKPAAVVTAPPPPPLPVVAEPACPRIAATATLDQAARLPRCK